MNAENVNIRDMLAALSPQDFLSVGVDQFAYIKKHKRTNTFGLYAANGHLIFETDHPGEAAIMAQQNNLQAVTVH